MQTLVCVGLFILLATGLSLAGAGCATGSGQASQEGCARARLARVWQEAKPAPFVGCFVDEGGSIVGTLVLTDVQDPAIYPDEPRRFQLGLKEAPTANPDARWELLATDLVRLSFPGGPAAGFQDVEACVEANDDDSRAQTGTVFRTLGGQTWARIDRAPFVGPPSPLRLRRVPCSL
jgi:hypothetical protein